MTNLVLTEDHGAVRVLTWNRPEKLNAFHADLYRTAGRVLEEARADDEVRCVVVTGAGRAFSAGQDLGEMAALAKQQVAADATERAESTKQGFMNEDDATGFTALLDALAVFDKPLVAAVHGVAIGIGATMLPYCDLVVMAESARMRTPFAELGVTAEAGSTYLFPERLGRQRAAAMLLAGEWMTAQQAVDGDFAYEVAPDGQHLTRALELATRVATGPLASLRSIKRLMVQAHADQIASARRAEERDFAALLGVPHHFDS